MGHAENRARRDRRIRQRHRLQGQVEDLSRGVRGYRRLLLHVADCLDEVVAESLDPAVTVELGELARMARKAATPRPCPDENSSKDGDAEWRASAGRGI